MFSWALLLTAAAWVPTPARWSPADLPVPYCITPNATRTSATQAEQRQAVERAISAWTSRGSGGSVSCTTYTARPASYPCTPQANGQDGRNNIFWERSWTNGSGAIGVNWTTGTGRACGRVTDNTGRRHDLQCRFDSDIEFNDRDYTWSVRTDRPRTDIESIAVHEYGHFLGLGHCSDNGTCGLGTGVMNAAYAGGILRVPFTDDIQGVCALYPGQPGGLGYPCTRNTDCNSRLCVGPSTGSYCTEPCGPAGCPPGYACGSLPSGAQVCLRDDGLERGACELCQLEVPNACAGGGLCLRGLPDQDLGRCVVPCQGSSCDPNFRCLSVQFQGGTSADFCVPRSGDCEDPGNFSELQLGQRCDGSQACADGLDCVGICAPSCASGQACPEDWACETGFREGAWCLPAVREGQDCSGLVTCGTGPCLGSASNRFATCYQDCSGDPAVCNAAQTCESYTLQAGGRVSVCEPPGVPPPPPDAGVLPEDAGASAEDAGAPAEDAGAPAEDAGAGPETPAAKPPNPCACDRTFACDPDGAGGACACDLECGCPCDRTFACDPGCEACDPECICVCDVTFACDPGCEYCDPECKDRPSCACHRPSTAPRWPALLLAALLLLGWFRRP